MSEASALALGELAYVLVRATIALVLFGGPAIIIVSLALSGLT